MRVYEVAREFSIEPEKMLQTDADAKKMLLLSGLMLADTMTSVEGKLAATEERLRAAEERARIAEAKSAMLAANALKLETEASHKTSPAEVAALREEHEAAVGLLSKLLDEINAIADGSARKLA